jgi:hypothetical protein
VILKHFISALIGKVLLFEGISFTQLVLSNEMVISPPTPITFFGLTVTSIEALVLTIFGENYIEQLINVSPSSEKEPPTSLSSFPIVPEKLVMVIDGLGLVIL